MAIGDERAKRWADIMHYTRAGEMIHAGVKRLQAIKGDARKKGLAWLLGYTAHVTTDVTIHPVVELKVGLLEDAGCSSEMDRHLWKEDPPKPCKVTLDAKEACPEPAK